MTTIYKEKGYTLQLDRNTLVVTDEGYGTAERFDYTEQFANELIADHKKLLEMAGE